MPIFRKKNKKKTWQERNPKVYSGVPRRESQEKRGKFSRFIFWVLLLGFFGVCAYMLFFSPFLEVEVVAVEGNQDISAEEISQKAREALQGRYFKYFSRGNFFLASRAAISAKLKSDFNRLEIWAIEKKFPRAILIRVKERQPEMVWCSSGVCYLVDKEGFVFSGANAADEELNKDRFLVAIDDNARPVEIGKTIISSRFIQYLKQMDGVLVDDLKMQVDGNYHTPALSSQEVIARIEENDGWLLKLSQTISPEETKKIIQTIFEKELDKEKRKNLEYLDLRVKGKVYYKLR